MPHIRTLVLLLAILSIISLTLVPLGTRSRWRQEALPPTISPISPTVVWWWVHLLSTVLISGYPLNAGSPIMMRTAISPGGLTAAFMDNDWLEARTYIWE